MASPPGTQRISVDVDPGDAQGALPVELAGVLSRFADAAAVLGAGGPEALRVVRVEADGAEVAVPHALSEELRQGQDGTLSWVAYPGDSCQFRVYLDAHAPSATGVPRTGRAIALTGQGDALRYNSGVGEPLDVGIPVQMPVLVDWDGDGRPDLIFGSTYANALNRQYNGTWFFRNVGTPEAPLFADFVRLRCDGVEIDTQVFDAVDWYGSGSVDLVGKPYGRNELQVYRNTGRRGADGLPELTAGEHIDLSPLLGAGGQCGAGFAQLVDLFGDGCLHLVTAVRTLADTSAYGHIFGPYYDNRLLIFPNQSPAGRPPVFGPPEPVRRADGTPLTLKGSSGGTIADWNGDGVWDVILAECEGDEQFLRLFRNAGTAREPELEDAGRLAGGRYHAVSGRYHGAALPTGAPCPFPGFLILEKSWMVRWLEDVAPKPGPPQLRDRGYLMQQHGRLSVGTYSWPVVCDWDGDGGRDIVAGSSSGSPYLFEEVGRQDPPVYRPRRILEAGGQPIRHTWGRDLGQTGGERTEGYWQPAIVDWDGDGLDDLLAPVGVAHGRLQDGQPVPFGRLYFYRNVGTRTQPRYALPQEILLADGTPPMATHVAVPVDWDGDGRTELVAFDPRGRLCVFAPTADPLVLQPGQPLRMADGRVFSDQVVYAHVGRPWGLQQAVCDWDGRGLWDVIVGTCEMLLLFRNQGTREAPCFADGERLCLWGEPIRHSVHSLRPCPVDWDGSGRVDLLVGSESGWFHLFRRAALQGRRPQVRVGPVEHLTRGGMPR